MCAFSVWYTLISLGYFKVFLTVLCRHLNYYFLNSHVHMCKNIYFEGVLIVDNVCCRIKFL